MRWVQRRKRHSSARWIQANLKNSPGVIASAWVPQYVSMRHSKYGLRHGVRREPLEAFQRNSIILLLSLLFGLIGSGVVAGSRPYHRASRSVHGHFDLAETAVQRLDRGRIGNDVLISNFLRYL